MTDQEPTRRAAMVLLVGASDGSGMAGIQADLRACAAVGARAATVITRIRPFATLSNDLVIEQLLATLSAHPIDAAKVGDVGDTETLAALEEHLVDGVVLDPELVDARGRTRHSERYRADLLPRLGGKACLLVVNAPEAEHLTGRAVRDRPDAREAAKRLWDHVPSHVLLCGGRLDGHAVDLLYDGRDFVELGADRRPTSGLRGQGAILSAAVAAHIARGAETTAAVHAAKQLVSAAIDAAVAVGSRRLAEPLGPSWAALGIDPEPVELEGD